MRFNKERAAPDVSQEDNSNNYSVTSLPTETGFRYESLTDAHFLCSFSRFNLHFQTWHELKMLHTYSVGLFYVASPQHKKTTNKCSCTRQQYKFTEAWHTTVTVTYVSSLCCGRKKEHKNPAADFFILSTNLLSRCHYARKSSCKNTGAHHSLQNMFNNPSHLQSGRPLYFLLHVMKFEQQAESSSLLAFGGLTKSKPDLT